MDEIDINTKIKDLMLEKLRIRGTDYRLKEFFDVIKKLGMIALDDYINEIMED